MPNQLLKNKKGIIFGALDENSIAWKTAEKVHKELKKIGGVKPPREFVLMDRAAIGLGSVFMHLKAEINWYRVFHELVGDFSEKNLKDKQNKVLKKVGLFN